MPLELSGCCRCSCVAQVNDHGGKCVKPDSCQCVDATDKPGITPLHVACSHAGLPVVQFLLERGADVNAVTVNDSLTPLQVSTFLQRCNCNSNIF